MSGLLAKGQNSSGEVIRPAGLKNELSKSLRKYLITTPLRIAHYFGQMARETGRFASFIENGDSSYFDMYEPEQNRDLSLEIMLLVMVQDLKAEVPYI